MKKFLNALAILLICAGLGLGAYCAADMLFPEAENLGQLRTGEESTDMGAADAQESQGADTIDAQESLEAESGDAQVYPASGTQIQETRQDDGTGASEDLAHAILDRGEQAGKEEQAGRLAYGLLDAEAQTAYEEMLAVIDSHAEEGELSVKDEELLPRAFEALTSDHGEIFWISGYRYVKESLGGVTTSIRFQPSYTMGLEERETYQAQVETRADAFLSGLEAGASDYEKVKAVYEMLSVNIRYNEEAAQNQNILSVFLGGQSVCNGIAASAQYLLTRLDVPCMTVYGFAGGEGHAWNLAKIDGEPYFFDATWGNNASEVLGFCSYEYLNLTSEDLAGTHRVNMELDLPECTAAEANYYVSLGLYFESYDRETVGVAVGRRYADGEYAAALRFSQAAAYEQALQELVSDGQISGYCPGLTSFRYMENDRLYILTLCW